jgi:hypothetical protein
MAGLRKAPGDGQVDARYVATSEPNTPLREFPGNRSHQRGKGYRMVKSAQFYSVLQILTGDMELEIVLYS